MYQDHNPDHARIRNLRWAKKQAEDRQLRAMSIGEWVADQRAIDRYQEEIDRLTTVYVH